MGGARAGGSWPPHITARARRAGDYFRKGQEPGLSTQMTMETCLLGTADALEPEHGGRIAIYHADSTSLRGSSTCDFGGPRARRSGPRAVRSQHIWFYAKSDRGASARFRGFRFLILWIGSKFHADRHSVGNLRGIIIVAICRTLGIGLRCGVCP